MFDLSASEVIDEVLVVDLDPSSLADYQLRSHCEVVASFVLLGKVEVGMPAALDPHVETSVVPPSFSHDFLGSQELLSLSFVHVEHEEQQFLRHLGDD